MHYRDRVVQHSLCDNVIAPYMERHLIYDNSASRIGKGTHFAMDRLTGFMRQYYKKYGNQTSSWFASFYLDGFNRLIKEKLQIKYYSPCLQTG